MPFNEALGEVFLPSGRIRNGIGNWSFGPVGGNLSFDPQSEGSRAWCDYLLISCYADNSQFLELIIQKLRDKKPDY